ncbi:hypothetical protein SteCoe_3603 [Stentor coeruleus]|uniref:Palmitoyltransferase n=1 Tax=Stentor coeruleus TaxID=5963 RepID=A0A1R2CWX2_9CILI|nr:hypothetical protein SteCoe_3603 [Stentor coeruleus]
MGLDVVHLASQGDFPQLIAYFSEIGVNLESIDTKGLTPLHWSSYMGNYYSSLLLCSLRVSRNIIDLEGHTPLHLAVIGNNLRVMKLLVIKGAIKDIKDIQGKTSMDYAIANGYKNLIESLKSNTFLEIMGFRPNITPFATSLWPFIILMGIIISTFVIVGIFCATYNRRGSYTFAASSIIVICLMAYIVKSDPGFVPKNPNTKLIDLYNNYKPGEICPDCGIVKVPRSRHCHQCHRCVKKFDHHCQWMNNCIGAKNLGVFYMFLLILWVNIIVVILLCVNIFISKKEDNDGDDIPQLASWIVAGLFALIELFMFFPVSLLLWTHTKNFSIGLTTNERVSAGRTTKKSSKNCCVNWKDMCCNSSQQEDRVLCSNYQSICSENLEESLHQIK